MRLKGTEGRDVASRPFFLLLFTEVRGETVWKVVMGSEIGVPEAAKRGRKSPDRPPFAAQAARSRGLWLFSKQFRKVNSAKLALMLGLLPYHLQR
jgi:hypothetical protein